MLTPSRSLTISATADLIRSEHRAEVLRSRREEKMPLTPTASRGASRSSSPRYTPAPRSKTTPPMRPPPSGSIEEDSGNGETSRETSQREGERSDR